MKIIQYSFFIVSCLLMYIPSNAQFLKKASEAAGNMLSSSEGNFTEDEAGQGIKAALLQGIEKGVEIVSVEDGYFGNEAIKILFPPEAQNVENKLRSLGFNALADDVILSMNRAAEDAAHAAKPIFVNAITSLTIQDAISLVSGNERAATNYLEKTTTGDLTSAFQLSIDSSLTKVKATQYWEQAINIYNKIPLIKKVNPDLSQYVTEMAIGGLFSMIAKEEAQIRANPAARTNEILKKVFGK